MNQEAYRDKARAVRREARAHLLELRRARQIRKGDVVQRLSASDCGDALSAPLAMDGETGIGAEASQALCSADRDNVVSGDHAQFGRDIGVSGFSGPENNGAAALSADPDEGNHPSTDPGHGAQDAELGDLHTPVPSVEAGFEAGESSPDMAGSRKDAEDTPSEAAGAISRETTGPMTESKETGVSGDLPEDRAASVLPDNRLDELDAENLSAAGDGSACVGAPGHESEIAAVPDDQTREDLSFGGMSRESDLHSLPGAGAGLVWMLEQCEVASLRDLAAADPDSLSEKLGVVGRLLNVRPWIDFAREHCREAE